MNSNPFHLCPSESEGFGHTIVEGLSCGALVVTTDAPPMNELVSESRGVLITAGTPARQRFGERFRVDPEEVSAAVTRVLCMPHFEIERRRQAARRWYEETGIGFNQRLEEALRGLPG